MTLRKILKDPLVHFLAIGLGFFLFFNLVSTDSWQVDKRKILINEQTLLEYMQFRAKAFDAERFKSHLASLSAEEKQQLIDGYIRDEVLYREAKILGMEQDDYIIRRRMISKLEYLTRSMSSRINDPTDEQLQALFQQRKDDYYVESATTFTHVFFDSEKHSWEKSLQLAKSQLEYFINIASPAFTDASKYGDRFPYHLNYVERTYSFIQSHFGEPFTDDLFSRKLTPKTWIGPIKSSYGYHLVLERKRSKGRYQTFDEVKTDLMDEFTRQQTHKLQDQAVKSLIEVYEVVIELPQQDAK